ncbi:MAG: hypothetical protein CMI13_14750 [Oleibacter sp.]|nr:hypothetical protein [Thalassolituus sp.]
MYIRLLVYLFYLFPLLPFFIEWDFFVGFFTAGSQYSTDRFTIFYYIALSVFIFFVVHRFIQSFDFLQYEKSARNARLFGKYPDVTGGGVVSISNDGCLVAVNVFQFDVVLEFESKDYSYISFETGKSIGVAYRNGDINDSVLFEL